MLVSRLKGTMAGVYLIVCFRVHMYARVSI